MVEESSENLLFYREKIDAINGNKTFVKLLEKDEIFNNEWDRLNNYIALIEDFICIQKELSFIGFLGHFSSGKTSLINSIMENCGANQDAARLVGENPTDTEITLIATTGFDFNKIRNISKIYTWIDTVLWEVPDGTLSGKILIDTPGIGNLEDEKIRSFFYICDIIVLVVNSRLPFGSTKDNFDLLRVKFEQLSHIPSFFIFTNSDNFLINRKSDYKHGWDKAHEEKFVYETFNRIDLHSGILDKEIINKIHSNERFFVDCIDRWNIDLVVDKIVKQNDFKPSQKVLALDREIYVANLFLSIITNYEKYIEKKLYNIKEILSEANRNSRGAYDALSVEYKKFDEEIEGIIQSEFPNLATLLKPQSDYLDEFKMDLLNQIKEESTMLIPFLNSVEFFVSTCGELLKKNIINEIIKNLNVSIRFLETSFNNSADEHIQKLMECKIDSLVCSLFNKATETFLKKRPDYLPKIENTCLCLAPSLKNKIARIKEAIEELFFNYERHVLQYLRYVYTIRNKEVFEEFGNSFLDNTEDDFLSFKIKRDDYRCYYDSSGLGRNIEAIISKYIAEIKSANIINSEWIGANAYSFYSVDTFKLSDQEHVDLLKYITFNIHDYIQSYKKEEIKRIEAETKNKYVGKIKIDDVVIGKLLYKSKEYVVSRLRKENSDLIRFNTFIQRSIKIHFPILISIFFMSIFALDAFDVISMDLGKSIFVSVLISIVILLLLLLFTKDGRLTLTILLKTVLLQSANSQKNTRKGKYLFFNPWKAKEGLFSFYSQKIKHESMFEPAKCYYEKEGLLFKQFQECREASFFVVSQHIKEIRSTISEFLATQRDKALQTPTNEIGKLKNDVAEVASLIESIKIDIEWKIGEQKHEIVKLLKIHE